MLCPREDESEDRFENVQIHAQNGILMCKLPQMRGRVVLSVIMIVYLTSKIELD
jgi:hypothetical protein